MALVAVLLILAMLMGLAAALTTAVTMDSGLLGGYKRSTTAFYTAESGLNMAMGALHDKFLAFTPPSGSDFNAQTFQLGQRTVSYQLTDPGGNPKTTAVPAGRLFSGLNSIEYTYIVDSQSIFNGITEADVGAEFDVENIPIFQFVAFYANDLEIMPGADMHLHGRVHTNGDLYLNSDAHLWIEDNQGSSVPASQKITFVQVTAHGDIHRGRKNDTSVCNGTVTVDMLQDLVSPHPDLDPQDLACIGGVSKIVPVSTLATWKGSMVSNVKSIKVPQPDIITMGNGSSTDGTYWTNADLRLVLILGNGSTAGDYSFVVENADRTTDATRTATLNNFISENPTITAAYGGTTTDGNTLPIFVTDTPFNNSSYCTCADNNFACDSQDSRCYTASNGHSFPANSTTSGVNGGKVCGQVYGTGTGAMPTNDPRRGGFYNHREKNWMILLNIDLHDLLAWNWQQSAAGKSRLFDPADTTNGGVVIFATVQGPESTNPANRYGVRLFGSANLPFPAPAGGDPTGVTFVTDQAVYVLGDFNRGPVYANDLVKQPAAILADSLNILSNGWFTSLPALATCTNDCQSSLPFADARRDSINPTAPATYPSPVGGNAADIINAAFLSGVDTTTSGNYNGGLENYPRFHEDWGGDYLAYHGSFVSLGIPKHVNGAWCGTGDPCGIYNPPMRNYDYDADFNNVQNLPPITPEFVYVQQIVFTENFK